MNAGRRSSAVRRFALRCQVPLVLGFVVGVQLLATALLLSIHSPIVHGITDEFAHVAGVFHLSTSLELGGLEAAAIFLRQFNSHYSFVPYFPLALAGLLWEPAALATRLANGLYFLVLVLSVYHLGKQCHSRGAGLLSAVLVSLMPATYGGWKTIGLDFPALCVTPLAMLMLLRCRGFRRRRAALLFGLFAGLAILVKAQVAFFVVPAAAAALLQSAARRLYGSSPRLPGRELLNAALAIGTVLAVTAVWWLGRVGAIAEELQVHSSGEGMLFSEGDLSTTGGVVFYLTHFPLLVTGVLTLALLLLLYPYVRHGRHRLLMLVWIAAPMVLHCVLKLRNTRYLFPLVPAVAVIIGVGLFSLPPRRRAVATAVVLAGAVALWIICPFSGQQCPSASIPLLRPYFVQAQRISESPAAMLLACGQAEYVAPICPAAGARNYQLGREAAHWIAGQQDRRRPLLVYYGVDLAEATAAMHLHLPRARLSSHDWMHLTHIRPPAPWQRFVMVLIAEQDVRGMVRRARALGRRVEALAGGGDDPHKPSWTVIIKLAPHERWPDFHQSGLDLLRSVATAPPPTAGTPR